MISLESRKQLLIRESEHQRERLAEGLQTLTTELETRILTLKTRARNYSLLALSAVIVVAALSWARHQHRR